MKFLFALLGLAASETDEESLLQRVRLSHRAAYDSKAQAKAYEVLHAIPVVDYVWADTGAREAALDSGAYIPENNVIAGIKVCNSDISSKCKRSRTFVTVPRWKTGVYSTLNVLKKTRNGETVLKPWPSVEAQDPTDCTKLQYAQSMEITPDGIMWVADVGRKYWASGSVDTTCPPKMVLLDIKSRRVVDTYVFPNDVTPYAGSFLNDIVVDVEEQVAYMSEMGDGVNSKGALVMYDRNARRSRRWAHVSTQAENRTFQIHEWENSGAAVNGIALTPDGQRVFYNALSGLNLYSVSASALRDGDNGVVEASLQKHGEKPDISDGMAFGSDGSLFFTGLTTDAIYRWYPSSGPVSDALVLAQDKKDLFWTDTLGFDNRGNLLVTSNSLVAFFNSAVSLAEPWIRVLRLDVGTNSYMQL